MLTKESDIEKFNKIASDLQAVIRDEFKILRNTQDLLAYIKEALNIVCVGSHKNKAVGQAKITCCSYVSLMFIYLIQYKNVSDDMNKCGYKDICGNLGPELQVLINFRKLYHPTIMNILTHDEPTNDPNFPDLGELVTLLNEVMPNPLINFPRAIDSTVGEYRSVVIRSDVEEGSADLDQSHFAWTAIGNNIQMLENLLRNGEDSTLGEYYIQSVTYT